MIKKLFKENDLFSYISNNIICYAKLPIWFKISTPFSTYNPDWALLIDKDGDKKLYFVLETKSNTLPESLRPTELDKIKCGIKHFKALGNEAVFESISDFDEFIENV